MTSILWRRIVGTGLERCELVETVEGTRISGTSLLAGADGPVEIRYSVAMDTQWRPHTVGVNIRGTAENRSVALRSDAAGSWSVGGEAVPDFAGATDVDFAWTPATDTIPLRRLALEIGERAEVTAIVVPFPGRDVTLRRQAYERLASRRYRHTRGDYAVDLTLNEDGFVVAYPGGWAEDTGS